MRADEKTGEVGAKSRVTDYLKNEVAERMFERFEVGPNQVPPVWRIYQAELIAQCRNHPRIYGNLLLPCSTYLPPRVS